MGLLVIFFLLSIVFSFLCSIWEAVLLSITPSYANRKVQEGTELGLTIQKFKEDIDRPLSAILTLNTIAHTVGAIGVGAQAAQVFGDKDISLGGISLSYESIIASLMTLAILLLSEIIPKTIGANMWKSLAPFTVRSISLLVKILSPFVWLSQFITKRLKNEKNKSVFSRADLLAMTDVGKESGAIHESESNIITNLLGLNNLKVYDIMTPRTVMQTIDEDTSLQEYYDTNQPLRFSRIPIFSDRSDHVVGMVLKDEILQEILEGHADSTLGSIKREIKVINQDVSISELFNFLTTERAHMLTVIDGYGSVVGLVTLEDVFETILGLEITDETDTVEDMQELAKKKWKQRAADIGLEDPLKS